MAFMLLEHYFGLRKADVLGDKPLPPNRTEPDWFRVIERLNREEPIQHVIGTTIFCGLEFEVSPDVLIPRPETEDLVRLIMHDFSDRDDAVRVVDIGTGSGCLAVTLARFLPQADVTGWDVSDEALAMAQRNADNLSAEVTFAHQDILTAAALDEALQFDCIVSNPPYVTRSEAAEMNKNVLDYEPGLALFVEDNDPLIFYKAVAEFSAKHLAQNGACYVEINERFGDATRAVFAERGFGQIQVYKDIHGKDRSLRASF